MMMMRVPDRIYILDLVHIYFSIEYIICVAVGSLCWGYVNQLGSFYGDGSCFANAAEND